MTQPLEMMLTSAMTQNTETPGESYALAAISPLDGRYQKTVQPVLSSYFSEAALIRTRVEVELEYLISLKNSGFNPLLGLPLSDDDFRQFILKDDGMIIAVKQQEATTRHDVKAVEYYLRNRFKSLPELAPYINWIHFGLTSQDVNQTAVPLLMKRYHQEVYLPTLEQVYQKIKSMGNKWLKVPMLSRTHGQPASPTTLGKEFYVYVDRLSNQLDLLNIVPFTAKFGGAVGNFNAHVAAFPNAADWESFADLFVGSLGLVRTRYTTQIEPYDNTAAYFDAIRRLNTILIDFCRDIWLYVSLDYFKQEIVAGEVGSSTMPHKVNPIDFENAEGNLGIANALLDHFSNKLPISRWQRDLTDSTVSRNFGVVLGHTYLAYQNILRGLGRLSLHHEKVQADLAHNWLVVAEGIMTILRREGFPDPYQAVKELTRTSVRPSQDQIFNWINCLHVGDNVKNELKRLTPFNYLGTAGNYPDPPLP